MLRSALALIAEDGPGAVTHRRVAARAGLPAATTSYYFAAVQDLIDEALTLHVEERVAELSDLADTVVRSGLAADSMIEVMAVALADRAPDAAIAQFQLYIEAGRRPNLQEPIARALAAFERLTTELLRSFGAREPEERAVAIVALVDGFLVHRVARPRGHDIETASLTHAIRDLVIPYVMPKDEHQRWIAHLGERISTPPHTPDVTSAG